MANWYDDVLKNAGSVAMGALAGNPLYGFIARGAADMFAPKIADRFSAGTSTYSSGVTASADSAERRAVTSQAQSQKMWDTMHNGTTSVIGGGNTTFNPLGEGIDWQKQYWEDKAKSDYASAAGTLTAAFEMYGLGGLAGTIKGMIMDGKPSAEVSILLRQTPEYKQRFPAMDSLAKKGRAMTEGEYIGLETSYDQALRSAGVDPKSIIGGPQDYYHYIANDVSVAEFTGRINSATTLVNNSNPEYVDAFQKYYGINKSDLLMYYLDPAKSATELAKKASIATVGGTATQYGLDVGEQLSRKIVDTGMTKDAATAFAKTGLEKEALGALSTIENQDLTTADIIKSNLQMDTESVQKTQGLKSRERARFSGKAGNVETLQQNVSGSY